MMHLLLMSSLNIYSPTSFSCVFMSILQSLKQEEEYHVFLLLMYSTQETQIRQLAAYNNSSTATKCVLPHWSLMSCRRVLNWLAKHKRKRKKKPKKGSLPNCHHKAPTKIEDAITYNNNMFFFYFIRTKRDQTKLTTDQKSTATYTKPLWDEPFHFQRGSSTQKT